MQHERHLCLSVCLSPHQPRQPCLWKLTGGLEGRGCGEGGAKDGGGHHQYKLEEKRKTSHRWLVYLFDVFCPTLLLLLVLVVVLVMVMVMVWPVTVFLLVVVVLLVLMAGK